MNFLAVPLLLLIDTNKCQNSYIRTHLHSPYKNTERKIVYTREFAVKQKTKYTLFGTGKYEELKRKKKQIDRTIVFKATI